MFAAGVPPTTWELQANGGGGIAAFVILAILVGAVVINLVVARRSRRQAQASVADAGGVRTGVKQRERIGIR